MAIDFSKMKELSNEAEQRAKASKQKFIEQARAKGIPEEKINSIVSKIEESAKAISGQLTAQLMEQIKEARKDES